MLMASILAATCLPTSIGASTAEEALLTTSSAWANDKDVNHATNTEKYFFISDYFNFLIRST